MSGGGVIYETAGRADADAGVVGEHEQVFVAGDDAVGRRGERSGEHEVVVRIATNRDGQPEGLHEKGTAAIDKVEGGALGFEAQFIVEFFRELGEQPG